jgi:DNA segregation ATPase FtsK/SpoIIIE, S-DNA-T family
MADRTPKRTSAASRRSPTPLPPPAPPTRKGGRGSVPARGDEQVTTWGRGQGGKGRQQIDVRDAIEGQEHEFAGLALVGAGVLVGLAVYFELSGVVGRIVNNVLGWLMGLGRYVVPVALVGVGVALIRPGQVQNRSRLTLGIAAAGVSILGLLHIARGDDKVTTSLSALEDAGGWLGAIVGEPLQSLLAPAGAVALLLILVLAATLLLSRMSLRAALDVVGRGVRGGVRPVRKAARSALGGVSTLSSERSDGGPSLYDAEADGFDHSGAFPPPSVADLPTPGRAGKKRAKQLPPPTLADAAAAGAQSELDLGPAAQRGAWKLPPASHLTRTGAQAVNRAEVEARGKTLQESLTSHGVETRLVGMTVGPTVTRFELELGSGVKVARVTSLQRDIAYAMAATDVRILAPIPGRSAIGVEVPNHTRHLVSLGDILASPEAVTASHPLDVAIGKDIAGRAVFLNLATTPHLLIAGATGAGKSSGINCIITSLLMRTTPDQVRLILIDPKQVEMGQYNRLPHLLTQPVTNPKKAANALAWAVKEMERRYDVLFEVGFRDITGYNAAFDRGELVPEPGVETVFERLPYIVVVVDELNDLMMIAARDVEESITRIAQKARAVGIHLIVATQRPSVNVITGVIKANVPARMAFAVSSQTDSRVILDQPGAEKLVGKGDMLLLPGNSNVAQRIQGSFVSEEEVRKVVGHWRRQAPEVVYVPGVEGDDAASGGAGAYSTSGDDDEDEVLMRQAMDLVVRSQLGSTSMLQRKLKVGFARAGRLMDLLEQRGVVGPSEGSKARSVLMTVEELELLQEAEREGR